MKATIFSILFCIPFLISSQTQSKYIVVDQFGYRPTSEKIAILRDPISGFDASESFAPSYAYAIVDATTNTQVYLGHTVPYNSGMEDPSSGDRVWWFDFSAFETPGTYYILDINQNLKSYDFVIAEDIYNDILKHAVRTFYYQRAGYAKEATYAGSNWADGASHLGPLQDTQARRWDSPNDASTEKDLSGGWYDAGDYNKYTTWTANYIVDLLKAYIEKPDVWTDDYNLPYSGNGIPDLIDEIKWGMDHLLRLQESDGSMISIVDLSHASPPSSATGQSLYGAVNTSSTLASAGAFALGSKVFDVLGESDYASTLEQSAIDAWNWAYENPNVIWENNSVAYNSLDIGAGQQETNDDGRFAFKMRAAIHLYDITLDSNYRTFIDNNYQNSHLILWNYAYPFEQTDQETLLYYTSIPSATPEVVTAINSTYENAMNTAANFGALTNETDPYLAHLTDYVWGSNGTKSRKGLMFMDYINYDINSANNIDAFRAAERYIHYLHGVNPLNFCYLSNMYDYGGDHGVNEFYHTWFSDGTDWDNAQNDVYGPAPGYVVGGANPFYDWDGCCPSGCGSQTCDANQVARINGQPKQKAYDDFNTTWPMNSWEVTENSNNYQVAYIRLLSKFIGLQEPLSINDVAHNSNISLHPNPFKNEFTITTKEPASYQIYDLTGRSISKGRFESSCSIGKSIKTSGIYFVKVSLTNSSKTFKLIKN
ncbi:glycoside hydrolase family 9 protein [Winogradskyella helgolandensis]|uniref:glycoside hydrolase family 9 protein n=1 Tax=Winogradskyella helgolandensis TaxID=2697010 RepID=UPI0015CBF833|nr:glycoside hydrolase family 9 protein [Winogradskyella helgolandensis]